MSIGGFIRRMFGPPSVPPSVWPERRGDDDWQVGDMAECIVNGQWFNAYSKEASAGPVFREIRCVADFVIASGGPLDGFLLLKFARWPGEWFNAKCFRKVPPRADAIERAEGAFTDLLKRKRVPAPQPVPAEGGEA